MTTSKLAPEVVSLLHHLELNKFGWWDVALYRLIIAALWVDRKPMSSANIHTFLRTQLFVETDVARLDEQISALISAGDVVELPDQRLKLTERVYGKFEAEMRDAESVREKAKASLRWIYGVVLPAMMLGTDSMRHACSLGSAARARELTLWSVAIHSI